MEVKTHYNQLANNTMNRVQRRQLRTFPIRDFNNKLKRYVLRKTSPHLPKKPRVLDLCCGRGGDIFKYNDIDPSKVVFVDISEKSIDEAQRRFQSGGSNIHYQAKFVVADCFNDNLDNQIDEDEPFDLILCHFAMHYAFENNIRLCNFFNSIRRLLKTNGYYICTVPSYEVLHYMAGINWQSFGNDVYKVQFDNTPSEEMGTGSKYLFSLEDAVQECPEYLVPTHLLNHYFHLYGLDIVLSQGFLDYASTQPELISAIPTQRNLLEVCYLYKLTIVRNNCKHMDLNENWIGMLQEFCQKSGLSVPVYSVQESEGGWVAFVSININGHPAKDYSDVCDTKKQARRQAAMKLYQAYCQANSTLSKEPPRDLLQQCNPEPVSLSDSTMVVHIDADHISFVNKETILLYHDVYFIFYCAHGADLAHVSSLPKQGNVEIQRAKLPMKNLADSMIIAQTAVINHMYPQKKQIVVSRDATVFHTEVLFPLTTKSVATKDAFDSLINGQHDIKVLHRDHMEKFKKIWTQ